MINLTDPYFVRGVLIGLIIGLVAIALRYRRENTP